MMITQSELKKLVHYDPNTGIFTWKKKTGHRIKIGDKAGSDRGDGYFKIRIKYKAYKSHRLAWLYVYGYFPENCIDHINGNPSDNRICNLRLATLSQNQYNRKKNSNNKSGIKGVYWNENKKKWKAVIGLNSKKIHLGYFNDFFEATCCIMSARNKLHGSFKNFG